MINNSGEKNTRKKGRPPSVSLLIRVKCVRKFVGNGGYLISDLLSRGLSMLPEKKKK